MGARSFAVRLTIDTKYIHTTLCVPYAWKIHDQFNPCLAGLQQYITTAAECCLSRPEIDGSGPYTNTSL